MTSLTVFRVSIVNFQQSSYIILVFSIVDFRQVTARWGVLNFTIVRPALFKISFKAHSNNGLRLTNKQTLPYPVTLTWHQGFFNFVKQKYLLKSARFLTQEKGRFIILENFQKYLSQNELTLVIALRFWDNTDRNSRAEGVH